MKIPTQYLLMMPLRQSKALWQCKWRHLMSKLYIYTFCCECHILRRILNKSDIWIHPGFQTMCGRNIALVWASNIPKDWIYGVREVGQPFLSMFLHQVSLYSLCLLAPPPLLSYYLPRNLWFDFFSTHVTFDWHCPAVFLSVISFCCVMPVLNQKTQWTGKRRHP